MRAMLAEHQQMESSSSRDYRQLRVWQRAMELSRRAVFIMDNTSIKPVALARTIIETAIQIPASIAAGYSRGSHMEFIRYMNIARGDLAALETYFVLSSQLGNLGLESRRQIEVLVIETLRLIDQTTEKYQALL